MNCLQACSSILWLARSPDLSFTQHTWDVIERLSQPFRNVDELAQQLETIWHGIPLDIILELYQSMPRWV
ncbi:hypothetical protein TNCV_2791521 [Trichonephila clavipes]|nr:hypothetical protein TNCV_2791521 [Trichonephila clavipes]